MFPLEVRSKFLLGKTSCVYERHGTIIQLIQESRLSTQCARRKKKEFLVDEEAIKKLRDMERRNKIFPNLKLERQAKLWNCGIRTFLNRIFLGR